MAYLSLVDGEIFNPLYFKNEYIDVSFVDIDQPVFGAEFL